MRAAKRRNVPLNLWGFIDGTVRPCCSPIRQQQLVYNSQRKVHGIKFQSVVTPDRLITRLDGPFEGKRHDGGVLRESRPVTCIRDNLHTLAYLLCPELIAPFKGQLKQEQELFNMTMSKVRMSVEW